MRLQTRLELHVFFFENQYFRTVGLFIVCFRNANKPLKLWTGLGGRGGKVKLKRTQASKPLAKALWALAKALSNSSSRNSSLSEPKANSEERS